MVSRLGGPALAWYASLPASSPLHTSWAQFIHEMDQNYEDPERAANARLTLQTLRQGNRSVAEYTSIFRQLGQDSGWPEDMLLHYYKLGLRDEI